MQDAIQRFINEQLRNPQIKAEYDRRVSPKLHVVPAPKAKEGRRYSAP